MIMEYSAGLPTSQVVEINKMSDLAANVTRTNPVLAATEWKASAELPDAAPGNHFIYARFSAAMGIDSVLRSAKQTVHPNGILNPGDLFDPS